MDDIIIYSYIYKKVYNFLYNSFLKDDGENAIVPLKDIFDYSL